MLMTRTPRRRIEPSGKGGHDSDAAAVEDDDASISQQAPDLARVVCVLVGAMTRGRKRLPESTRKLLYERGQLSDDDLVMKHSPRIGRSSGNGFIAPCGSRRS